MLIAHLGTSISLNQVVLNQMTHQRDMGHEVVALCPNDEWAEGLKARDIAVMDVPFVRHSALSTLVAAVSVWTTCRRERFDVVHTHNSFPGVVGRVAARLAGVPAVVHTCHAWPLHQPRRRVFSWVYKVSEALAARAAHAVLFQNPDDRQSCIDMGIVPPRKAALVGNGIDVNQLISNLRPDARQRIRHEFGISDRAFVLANVARLEVPKGHSFLLRGLRRLLMTSDQEVVMLLVGTGRHEERIRAQVNRLRLEPFIRFTGYRDDIPDILTAADASVLTSLFEGVPRALMESMALGLPIVATDVPGTRTLVETGTTGLLVTHGDVNGLATCLKRVMENLDLAKRLGDAGRTVVLEKFNERTVADRVIRVYEHVRSRRNGLPPGLNADVGMQS